MEIFYFPLLINGLYKPTKPYCYVIRNYTNLPNHTGLYPIIKYAIMS